MLFLGNQDTDQYGLQDLPEWAMESSKQLHESWCWWNGNKCSWHKVGLHGCVGKALSINIQTPTCCHRAQSLRELDWPLHGLERASPFKSYIQYVFLEAPYLLSAASCLFQLRSSRQFLEHFKPTKQSSLLILAVPKCFQTLGPFPFSVIVWTSRAQLTYIYSHWPGPKSLQTRHSCTSNIHAGSLPQDRLAVFLASLENSR